MAKLGYRIIVIFPLGEPEPLYCKTMDTAIWAVKNHGEMRGTRAVLIEDYLKEIEAKPRDFVDTE